MIPDASTTTYETTHLRTLGWAGAICFTLAPPAFLYEWWLTFYTTAMEENPTIGPLMAVALVLSFASVPMMIVGRRKRVSASPTVDAMPPLRRREAGVSAPRPGRSPL